MSFSRVDGHRPTYDHSHYTTPILILLRAAHRSLKDSIVPTDALGGEELIGLMYSNPEGCCRFFNGVLLFVH
jgi:hypothetical protein